jgi:predicted nucleic acid-binding protein
MFLLDTDVLSALAKRRREPPVERWLARRRDDELFLSVVSVGEIERGIEMQRDRDPAFAERLADWFERLLAVHSERVLPFDLAAARRWGELNARISHGGADLQIAATALTRGLTVATRNGAHFAPTGVAVVNPFEAREG